MSEEEKEIRKLIEDAELDVKADDLKEAGEKLGQAMQIAKNIGNEVYGIDIRSGRVERAKQKGVKASVADLTKALPFKDEFFDLIYAAEVLEHIYDTEFFCKRPSAF